VSSQHLEAHIPIDVCYGRRSGLHIPKNLETPPSRKWKLVDQEEEQGKLCEVNRVGGVNRGLGAHFAPTASQRRCHRETQSTLLSAILPRSHLRAVSYDIKGPSLNFRNISIERNSIVETRVDNGGSYETAQKAREGREGREEAQIVETRRSEL